MAITMFQGQAVKRELYQATGGREQLKKVVNIFHASSAGIVGIHSSFREGGKP